MFAVIADNEVSEMVKFVMQSKLTDLEEGDIHDIVENLAENNSVWESVLKGTRVAIIFDEESGDKITINRKKQARFRVEK